MSESRDADREIGLLAVKIAVSEGRHREALDLLDRVEAHTAEEQAQKLVLAGQSFEGLDDVGRAHEAYSQAQSLAPAFHAPILREAVLRYRRGDREGARMLLYRYVEHETGNPEAFYYLSLCELDPMRQAQMVRTVAILDDASAVWSKQLLRFLAN